MNQDIFLRHACVTFQTGGRQVSALRDATIRFPTGQVTALVGESGSGKSVLGMSLLQLLPSTARVEGSCHYGQTDLYRCSEAEMREIRCKHIGLIPQNPVQSLNPVLRLSRQLTEPLRAHCGKSRSQALASVRGSLRSFGFSSPDAILNSYSFQLSGGMNQRIVTCMGLACQPEWVIADEPTKGLDTVLRRQVYDVLRSLRNSGAGSMILITHDLLLARKLCDRVAVLYQGMIVEQGPCAQIFDHPRHPYTQGLVRSIPECGMMPIPSHLEQREASASPCPFYVRCAQAGAACTEGPLPAVAATPDSFVRCIHYAQSRPRQ